VGVKIEETFQVQAPASRVWEFLVDPAQVVQCLPGAELVEVQDESSFLGRVKVKVGPVSTSYKGKASFIERDDANRRVKMQGSGQETTGSGSAKMTMTSEVVELPDGTAEVRVHADLEVVGRIVQFGRGMIEEVNRQLFKQFVECTRARLAQPAEAPKEPPRAAPAEVPSTESAAPGAAAAAPTAPEADTLTPPPEAVLATTGAGIPPAGTPAAATSAAAPIQPRPQPRGQTAAGPELRALPLFFRALWAMVRRFFARLFGRG
jgi:uncharacterized protein